jgi:hypothetical protein
MQPLLVLSLLMLSLLMLSLLMLSLLVRYTNAITCCCSR